MKNFFLPSLFKIILAFIIIVLSLFTDYLESVIEEQDMPKLGAIWAVKSLRFVKNVLFTPYMPFEKTFTKLGSLLLESGEQRFGENLELFHWIHSFIFLPFFLLYIYLLSCVISYLLDVIERKYPRKK